MYDAIMALPVIPYHYREVILLDLYTSIYFGPPPGNSPFTTVLLYPEEDTTDMDPINHKLRVYESCNLKDYFPSFLDYLKMDAFTSNKIATYARKQIEAKHKMETEGLAELRGDMNGLKIPMK